MSKQRRKQSTSLRAVQWKRFLRAPDAQLLDELYAPALSRAVRYARCCAYFSSRVLSVAARGFGGFIHNLLTLGEDIPKPAARLLVNEQLDPGDLNALLASGDASQLIEKLLKQFVTPKDALEKNRLEMLAWLVASGWLEVRVGLMRHTRGLSHAKFGIITDIHGDSLAFMGSDNETGQALIENYEEIEVRPSWQDQEFADYYRERFETLWADQDESVTTLPLPDAVKLKLIQLAPKEPPAEVRQDKDALASAMLWHFIAAAPYLPDGEYTSDATALVELWPHQRRVVEDTATAFPDGRLLCDEVGMGKTIEAILVLRRLLCGRGVKRALLLVPAGLLIQWGDELREKGGLLVPRWESGNLYFPDGTVQRMEAAEALSENDLLLLSREWARLENNRAVLLNAPVWDVVLLDEAHAARRSAPEEREFNSANLLLQLLRELQLRRRTRGILLLSATPMQTQPWEPWDLLAVLGVGGKWLVEFSDLRTYYKALVELERGTLVFPTAQAIAQLVASDDEFPPPPNGVSPHDPSSIANALLFAFGDQQCRHAQWLRQGAPLGRCMHRNTRDTLRGYYERGLIPHPPPRREVRDEVFDYQEQAERDCYNGLKDYINERYDQLEGEKRGKGFVMTIYWRRASSSPHAIRCSLKRRLDGLERVIRRQWTGTWLSPEAEQVDLRDLTDADLDEQIDPAFPTDPRKAQAEKEELESLLHRLDALGGTDSKFSRFWSVLQEMTADGRPVLVFTEYTDTMTYLRDLLTPNYGGTLGCYSGSGGQVWDGGAWAPVPKAEITERLAQGKLKVLLCTDAASEGLNLQAAGALVNYDLPWNPSKVEQRIGRIDRIGQQQPELPIRNLFLKDSVDMRVYQALRRRCRLFEHFVGRMQPVLALVRDALRRHLRDEETDAFLEALHQTADAVEADESVANTFIESEVEAMPAPVPPVTRQDIETALVWLAKSGENVKAKRMKGHKRWRLNGLGRSKILGTERAIEVTTDRETLERERNVIPLTVGTEVMQQLVERLRLPSLVLLVLAESTSGAYRCVEARWVGPDHITVVQSAKQLSALIDSWDGGSPSPALLVKTQQEARDAARRRVEQMVKTSHAKEEANLRCQVEAARYRLKRELGRTLRCLGTGDLNALFRRQVQRESASDGRYHQALRQLDGYPVWTDTEVEAIGQFVNALKNSQRTARLLGSEVDAALDDPRWQASYERAARPLNNEPAARSTSIVTAR